MAWINWDHSFIVGNLIPLIKRKLKTIDWLYALTFPVKELNTEIFVDYYDDTTNISQWKSNTISFETILNEEFSLTYSVGYTGSIFLSQPEESIELSYMWGATESIPPAGATAYMYGANEVLSGSQSKAYMYGEEEILFNYDFTINAPTAISGAKPKLASLANQIKIAGTKYKIVYF